MDFDTSKGLKTKRCCLSSCTQVFIKKGVHNLIDFQSFGIENNAPYKNFLHKCIQIPWNLSPLILLNDAKRFDLKRGYAADLCWHKRILNDGTEY